MLKCRFPANDEMGFILVPSLYSPKQVGNFPSVMSHNVAVPKLRNHEEPLQVGKQVV